MAEVNKRPCFQIVELSPEIRVKTSLPPACHSALRSGFAGYSTNPRWNGAKLRAWRLGKEWRHAFEAGDMKVCGPDALLMPSDACEQGQVSVEREVERNSEPVEDSPETRSNLWRSLVGWSRKKLVAG